MTGRRQLVVRRPGPQLAEGLTLDGVTADVDLRRANDDWQAYVDVFEGEGWTVVETPAADDCPDAVFIEDAVVVFDDLAVVCRPGAPTRQPETAGIAELFAGLGLRTASITRGTLDGGDVLKVGRTVYVGLSDRTTRDAIEELAEIIGPTWTVIPVHFAGVLHLKSAITALPDGQLIGMAECIDDPEIQTLVRTVPEEHGSHVVVIDESHLVMSASAPKTAALFETEGYRVSTVDLEQFEKLDGCVTCLSVRIR